MDELMDNSSLPWAAHCTLIYCRLVVLGKRTGVRPVVIEETLLQALTKIVMRTTGDQENIACGNFQLCADLEASIE